MNEPRSYFTGDAILQELLRAHHICCVNHIWDAAENVQKAIHAFRKQEYDEYSERIEALTKENAGDE